MSSTGSEPGADEPGRLSTLATIREWLDSHISLVLVYLVVAAASLSAYAIWEATERGDDAQRIRSEIEFTANLLAERESALEQQIAYDLRLLPRYATALHMREAMLEAQMWEEAGRHDAERRVLEPYFTLGLPSQTDLLTTNDTGAYDPGFVADRQRFLDTDRLPQRIDAWENDVADLQQSQTMLLFAAVAFALVVAVGTFAELAKSPSWSARWAVAAFAMLIVGVLILMSQATRRFWILGLVAIVFWGLQFLARFLVPQSEGRGSRWMAELLGGVTVVALTLVVVLLASASQSESEALNRARQINAHATEQLLKNQQDALDDLDAAVFLESLEARLEGFGDTADGVVSVEEIPERVRDTLGEDIVSRTAEEDRSMDVEMLRAEASVDVAFVSNHIAQSVEPALVGFAQAELVKLEAADWGQRVAQHTLALVVLGLGAYMFSLASDEEGRRLTASWLLAAGVLGLVAGVAVSAFAVTSSSESRDHGDFAEAFAAGRVAFMTGDCETAVAEYYRVLEAFPEFTTAAIERALSRDCLGDTGGIYSPEMSEPELSAYMTDLSSIISDQPDATLSGLRGWGHLLEAFNGKEGALDLSKSFSSEALSRDASHPVFHFNLALAELTSGDDDAARAAYELAMRCVLQHDNSNTEEPCDGDDRGDSFSSIVFLILALGDLDLLETSLGREVTHYKEMLLTGLAEIDSVDDDVDQLSISSLDIFPQELQVITETTPELNVSLIWYHRPRGATHWGILWRPTLSTATNGVLNEPVEAGMALPGGEYRVDLYLGGRFVASQTTGFDGMEDGQRLVLHDLGFELVLPTWESRFTEKGLWREYRDPSDDSNGIQIVRLEGWPAPTADLTLESDLNDLTETVFDLDIASTGEQGPETYFLGVDFASREYANGRVWAAAGFSAYCDTADSPGTLIAIWIERPQDVTPWEDQVIESLRLLGGTQSLMWTSSCASGQDASSIGDDAFQVIAGDQAVLDVLANDTEFSDLDPSTLLVVDSPTLGSVEITLDWFVTYEAPSSSLGEDSFIYEVCDSEFEECVQATVSVDILERTIVNLVPAPTGPECFDHTETSSTWTALGMPEPVEIWRCDYQGEVDLYVEYLRFDDDATANIWAEAQFFGLLGDEYDIIHDGSWERGDDADLGLLKEWTSVATGMALAHTVWVYEAEAVVGFVWAPTQDHGVVADWWTENA